MSMFIEALLAPSTVTFAYQSQCRGPLPLAGRRAGRRRDALARAEDVQRRAVEPSAAAPQDGGGHECPVAVVCDEAEPAGQRPQRVDCADPERVDDETKRGEERLPWNLVRDQAPLEVALPALPRLLPGSPACRRTAVPPLRLRGALGRKSRGARVDRGLARAAGGGFRCRRLLTRSRRSHDGRAAATLAPG